MDDKRKHERHAMIDDLPITIPVLGDDVGKLMDLTRKGSMIRYTLPMKPKTRYRLHVKLTEPVNGREEFELVAECIWCRPAPGLNGYNAGTTFVNLEAEILDIIDILVAPGVPTLD